MLLSPWHGCAGLRLGLFGRPINLCLSCLHHSVNFLIFMMNGNSVEENKSWHSSCVGAHWGSHVMLVMRVRYCSILQASGQFFCACRQRVAKDRHVDEIFTCIPTFKYVCVIGYATKDSFSILCLLYILCNYNMKMYEGRVSTVK